MRRTAIALLCVAFLLVGASCGGGDDEAADDTVVTETTGTTDETTETTTDDDLDTSDLDAFASEECLQLVSAGAEISEAFSAATTGGDLDEVAERFAELVDKAPSEIRADLATIAEFFTEYAEVLRDLELQPGEAPSAEDLQKIQAAFASIDQPELTAASERISTWAEENCQSG